MWQLRPYDKNKEVQFLEKKIPRLLARLLSQRPIPVDKVDLFLEKNYKDISRPHSLKDVDKAARIFCQAILNKKSIAVIGDYDCDGIISSVMISELCTILGSSCRVFLPSRFEHGYGLNAQTIKAFKEFCKEKPPYLLTVVDSGSNNEKEIKQLKKFGIEKIIIIDHHSIDKEKLSKSADALINWHLSDHHEMCAAGEVYQFIRGIRCLTKKIDPIEFLSYAAIGTIADVTPIIGDNRIIVAHGLEQGTLNKVPSFGLMALINKSGLESNSLSQTDIAFQIAPKINAVGRLEDPRTAFDLFLTSDSSIANITAEHLIEQNDKRKSLQRYMALKAAEKALEGKFNHGILVYDSKWNIGIAGIVASKLVETFHKPCIVLGEHNGLIKGSGRSIEGINLIEILDSCKEMFDKYGGHALAGGVTLKKEFLDKSAKMFDEACGKYYLKHELPASQKINYYDASLKLETLTSQTATLLADKLYPYCNINNPEPIFCLSDVKVLSTELIEGKTWKLLKFGIAQQDKTLPFEVSFFTQKYGTEISGHLVNLYFSFPQSTQYGAFDMRKLTIKDIEFKDKK